MQNQKYIDIHCHLPLNYFYRRIDALLEKYRLMGIQLIVSISQDYKDTKRSLELARKYPDNIIPTLGIHPWKAHKKLNELEFCEDILKENPNIRILGEIGLDYHFISQQQRHASQKEVFNHFLKLAERRRLPMMLHVKGAENEVANYIETSSLSGNFFCIHWFSGPTTILNRLADLDCYFSCGPALDYSPKHQNVAKVVHLDRILTESDGNVKYRGKIGHPGLIPEVIATISSLKQCPEDKVQHSILKNSYKYLRIPFPGFLR
ncbi:MAG: TatD family hydrolase [Candidatus Thorarchaeota archaeon]